MKNILFIRHAKSSWDFPVDDLERPIKSRGRHDIKLISKAFSTSGFIPEMVFSSPARRAQETAQLFLKHSNFSSLKIKTENDLYDFSGSKVENFIRSLSDSYKSIIIFGHNFALTELSNRYGNRFIDNLPTSGLVQIEFATKHWSELNVGVTKTILIPKELR